MNIIIIEDEKILSRHIKEKLEKNKFKVTIIESYSAFIKMNYKKDIDLFLIDVNLGDGSGIDITKILKNTPETKLIPIILISGHDETHLKVQGLDAGSDDYIVKPFDFEELYARIRRTLRKDISAPDFKVIKYKNILFNTGSRKVFIKGKEISLSKKEKQILEYILLSPDKCIKKTDLHRRFWENNSQYNNTENTINVTMCNLRKKLGDTFVLKTIVGEGYCLYKKIKK